jgi:pimeloyl-ACP methyl ester carboxylesterase
MQLHCTPILPFSRIRAIPKSRSGRRCVQYFDGILLRLGHHTMDPFWWLLIFWVDGVGWGQVPPRLLGPGALSRVQRRLCGQIVDFTHNHGHDRRIWSSALCQYRDLYVYLPPGFDPGKKYPLAIFLHGAAQDENFFLQAHVSRIDRAIVSGELPPLIVAAPDGSLHGRATMIKPATFYANSRVGQFEDYVMYDVWNFLHANFPIRPEREAHALIGVSMGGSAAYALAIKHRDRVKLAVGIHPPLNLRWSDSQGNYRVPFDPEDWGWRERLKGWEPLGRRRFFTLRFRDLYAAPFGRGTQAMARISEINPLEMLDAYDVRPGELSFFAAYGGRDEFNIAAQVESFLWRARERGLQIDVAYDPLGKHDLATGLRLLPEVLRWSAARTLPPH